MFDECPPYPRPRGPVPVLVVDLEAGHSAREPGGTQEVIVGPFNLIVGPAQDFVSLRLERVRLTHWYSRTVAGPQRPKVISHAIAACRPGLAWRFWRDGP